MTSALYVASIFVSALLLFLLQPIVARLLLPEFGGSPAVWNTCMVFFQSVLLAGYAYAHASLSRLGVRRQRWMHVAVLLLSLLMLPRALHFTIVGDASPVALLLAALMVMAGVPFFVLSTNSSLTQRWFSLSNLDRRGDPFWLYAASNVGSLVALLAYPFVVEPALGLRAQLRWWSVGYAVFVALSLAVMMLSRRTLASNAEGEVADVSPPIEWPRRLRWTLLAAIASSLLLSVTMQITTDVMSAPLFWVLPLAIYLLTFVIAFAAGRRPSRQLLAHLTTIGIALCFAIVVAPSMLPLWFALIALLGTLFTGALLCHSDLADDRPTPSRLTDFYLALAVGGALGGVANSIVAPLMFKSVVEFPLTLVALALVLRPLTRPTRSEIVFAVVSLVAIVAAGILVWVERTHGGTNRDATLHWQLMPLAVLAAGVLLSNRATVFPVAAILSASFVATGLHFVDPIVDEGRSFFGVSRVTETSEARILVHGVTVHGAQFKDPSRRDTPVSYYYPRGPLGWAVSRVHPGGEIGIVGLGAGSLTPLARGGQRITYFEIDPLVEQIARRDFTYLDDAHGPVTVRIGDGRQLLAREPDARFDLLVIDAFSSDAIPTHLLTDEAIALYLRKLKPGGLLVLHISNRYADLSRVFRGWRRRTGMRVAVDQFIPTPQEEAQGVLTTVAVAIGHSPAALAPLAATGQWFWLDDAGPAVDWTDDHSDLLSVLDKNILKP